MALTITEGENMRDWVGALAAAAVVSGSLVVLTWPAPADASVNWTQKTCGAFAVYEHHQTTGNLDALVADSLRLPHGYLAADVAGLLADSVTAKPKAKYITKDVRYVAGDCA